MKEEFDIFFMPNYAEISNVNGMFLILFLSGFSLL